MIALEETVVGEFEVQAENFSQALDIAEDKYKSGEFVLEPGEVTFKQISVIAPDNESTDWKEF